MPNKPNLGYVWQLFARDDKPAPVCWLVEA